MKAHERDHDPFIWKAWAVILLLTAIFWVYVYLRVFA
jgi:hypothetical protein